MNAGKIIFGSLALDLHRVAMGYHNKSFKMADRFMLEVQDRTQEAMTLEIQPYMKPHIAQINKLADIEDIEKRAEDALTYSVIVQNYCMKYC